MTLRSPGKSLVFVAVLLAASSAYSALAGEHSQHGHSQAATGPAETAYWAENDSAMDRMMEKMEIEPTGDVDRDFVAMMIPHHQGAIDMGLAYLKYGRNEQLRRIAQEIIVDQQQEIAAMKLAVGDPLPPSDAAPTQVVPENNPAESMPGMDPNMKM